MNKVFSSYRLVIVLPILLATIILARPANAFKPTDPEVQAIILPGIKFLEKHGARHKRLGGTALIGLVLYKHTHDPKHPVVLDSLKVIRDGLGDLNPRQNFGKDSIYDVGLMVIFLAEVNPTEYASEIKCLLQNLMFRQKACGAWGYGNRTTGDTSMTQYGVLGFWTAVNEGFEVPVESIERVSDWLLRTQDPSGAYGYQGTPSTSYVPIRQDKRKHALTAAGLGSVYICADMLGMKAAKAAKIKETLAPALKRVKKVVAEEEKKKKVKTKLSSRLFHPVQHRGNGWFAENYVINPPEWPYYYMYGFERYMSYREEAEGRVGSKRITEPKWYNDGVLHLKSEQKDDGSWAGPAKEIPSTCFALLFLLRSSGQKIMEVNNFGDGDLVGARGLPKDTTNVEIRNGQVTPKSLAGPAAELLAALEKGDRNIDDYSRIVNALPKLPSTEVEAIAAKHKDLIEQLAKDQSGEARIAAVQTMAKTRDFDYVPILIYVLRTDTDKSIARQARDVLRRFARKPDGFNMPDEPDESDRRAAVAAWKDWYLAVRPNAKFKN